MTIEKNTVKGDVRVSTDVIAQYAGLEAMGCFGIVGMGAMSAKDGIVKLLRNDKLSRGVSVNVRDSHVTIDFHVIVAYGVSIQAVAENLINNVVYQVESFTGMTVDKINVLVEGVRVID